MSNLKHRPPRLGRGLSSLMGRPVSITPPPANTPGIPQANPATPATESATPPQQATPNGQATLSPGPGEALPGAGALHFIPVDQIRPNRHQPRQHFDEDALQRLADSIQSEGVIQPIILRISPEDKRFYELVAGERRWRAAQLAGLTAMPALVRDLDDRQVAEWALVENLQREDLNPIERAEAFNHLIVHFNLSHEAIADRVGVERSTITNSLRLLELDESVKTWVRAGTLSVGQAKIIASTPDVNQQKSLCERALKHGWSVRQLEVAVRHATGETADTPEPPIINSARAASARSTHLADLEEQIGQQLQTKVHIRPGRRKGSGTLTIEFYSIDQFDSLMGQLGVKTEE